MAPPFDICIIYNPYAGRKRGSRTLQALRDQWAGRATLLATSGPGDAERLAEQAAHEGYRVVAAAGGDGTAHEVANGLLDSGGNSEFAVVPLGSANDYAYSVNAAWPAGQTTHAVDVGLVTSPGGRRRYFVCCLGLGFNGAVTLESRKIRWLRGLPLYGLATLRALWRHYRCSPMQITFDDQPTLTLPTFMLSVLVGQREGSFVLAPRATLDDGLFDYLHAGKLSRWGVLRLLPRLAVSGPPEHHPQLRQGQCRGVRVRTEEPLIVHVDGEFYCKPEDAVRELDIRIIPAGLRLRKLL